MKPKDSRVHYAADAGLVIGHLIVCDFFVERPTVMSEPGVGLDVLSVGPGALIGLVTFFVVYMDLQHKRLFSAPLKMFSPLKVQQTRFD